jgi:hypothetical protein
MKANPVDRKTSPADQGEFDERWVERLLDLNIDEVLALQVPSEIASYCERVLDIPTLIRDLEDEYAGYGTARQRKQFCEYLGIGQSTLSGWLKQQRVPRMAKEAYVLLKTLLLLQDEVKRLKQARNDVVIVEDRGRYQLVQFHADNTGAMVGTIMARDIPDEGNARILAGSTKAFDTLKDFRDALIDIVGDGSELDWENTNYSYKQLNCRLLRDSLAAFGTEEWIKRFLPNKLGPEFEVVTAWQVLAEVDLARAQDQLTHEVRRAQLDAEIAQLEAKRKTIEEAAAKATIAKAQADRKAARERAARVSPSPRGDSGNKPTAVEDAAHQENSLGKRGANGKAKT